MAKTVKIEIREFTINYIAYIKPELMEYEVQAETVTYEKIKNIGFRSSEENEFETRTELS